MRHPSLLAIPFLIFVFLATAAAQQDASPTPSKYQDAATHGDTQAMTEIGRAYETGQGAAKDRQKARAIAAEVGRAVSTWRGEAAMHGFTQTEIDRMASAFEHEDLKMSLAGL